MSVKVMGHIWDRELKPTLKLVLLAYADHANHDGGDIYPSVGRIANKTGFSERTIQNATKELEEMGILILIDKNPGKTKHWQYSWGESPAPQGESNDMEGVNLTTQRGESPAPEPLLTINKEPSEDILTQEIELLNFWKMYFPDKRQPKSGTYRSKLSTRFNLSGFNFACRAAMRHAATRKLGKEDWFTFEWLIRNADNVYRVTSGEFDWLDKKNRNQSKSGANTEIWDQVREEIEEERRNERRPF